VAKNGIATDKKWLKGRLKHLTGFCANGFCEGTKPLDRDGQPRKVCEFWTTCPCKCHKAVDEMYAMVGMERQPAEQSPEYRERIAKLHLETRAMLDSLPARGILSNIPVAVAGDDNEGTPTGTPDSAATAPLQPVFGPTPTGRRARGQLEYDVLAVCMDYAKGVFDWDACLPKLVSEEIAKRNHEPSPSTGAIDAVWDRWVKLDFAVRDKKPSRFVKFIPEEVSPMVLESYKARAKREKRRGVAEAKRNPHLVRRGA